MPEQRRRFSPQFKAGAVQLVLETGRPIAQVARELGIYDGTLGNWVNAWRRDHPEPEQPLSPVERARIAWMCRMLGVPRSTFYAWRHRAKTPTAARRRELAAPVRRVFDESRQTSGCRRVAAS